jgi:hypothetical protein
VVAGQQENCIREQYGNQVARQMDEVLRKAIERHGGLANYQSIGAVKIKMNRLGGSIPVCKGLGRTFPHPDRATVDPHRKSAVFHGFGTQGEDVTYLNGTIISAAGRHENYRATFDGLRKLRFWSANDAAYFFGYALSDYFSYPFSLTSREILDCQSLPNGQARIAVRFPKDADTHSQYQSFWFDESGLLYRHDYRADVLGPIFFGAHHSTEYRFDLPIPFAEIRTVKVRAGTYSTPITVLHASFSVESVSVGTRQSV